MSLVKFKKFLFEYRKNVYRQIMESDEKALSILDSLNSIIEEEFETHTIDIDSKKDISKRYLSYDDIWYKHLERKAGYLSDKVEGLRELYDFLGELSLSYNGIIAIKIVSYLEGLFYVCDKALKEGAIDIKQANKVIGSMIYLNSFYPSKCDYDDAMKRAVFQISHFYDMQGQFEVLLDAEHLKELYRRLLNQFEEPQEYTYMVEGFCSLYSDCFEECLKRKGLKKVVGFEEYKRSRNMT